MGNFLSTDGKFMNFLTKVSDTCIISFLWLLCCLPVVTIGASTTAAYYTLTKVVKRQTGTLGKEFFRAFKNNWKDSFLINLVYLFLTGLLAFNIYTMYQAMEDASYGFAFQLLFFYLTLLLLMLALAVYTYPVLSRFEMGRLKLIKFSAFAMFRHFPTTLLLLVWFLLSFAVIIVFPVGVIFMPGICLYVYSFLMEPVLRKYMTAEMLAEWDRGMEEL